MALLGVGCFGAARLSAQPLLAEAAAAPQDDGVIDAALREQAARAHTHRYVWTGINAALAVGSFALIPVVARESRRDFVVAGVGSALGTLATLAFPLRVESAPAELDSLANLPPARRRQRQRELLRADAQDERERRALLWHAANLGVSALAGGIIALGFRHTLSGVTQGLSSFALGEAQLFTQPTGLHAVALTSARYDVLPLFLLQSRSVGFSLVGVW